jgi:hypothetical protein
VFRVYLRTSRSKILLKTRVFTPDVEQAIDAFMHLVNRVELDGTDYLVVLTWSRRTILRHDFSGHDDSWRGRRDSARYMLLFYLSSH